MIWLEIWFWLSALGIAYVYLGYPLLVGAAARVFGRPLQRVGQLPRSISILIAAHDEEAAIVRRIRELNEQLSSVCIPGEIIVVSDGSTDSTAGLARSQADANVRVVELEQRAGKAAALTLGCAEATGEVLVFGDVRQTWAPVGFFVFLPKLGSPERSAVL